MDNQLDAEKPRNNKREKEKKNFLNKADRTE